MPPLMLWVLVVAALFVAIALIATLLEIRRAARQAAAVLFLVEQELRPLSAAIRSLLEEARGLSSRAERELAKFGAVMERIELVSDRIARLVGVASSVGKVGQIVGAVSGVKKGLDVFLARLLTRNKSE